jgi:hypothetical protein
MIPNSFLLLLFSGALKVVPLGISSRVFLLSSVQSNPKGLH